ncbi:hypothetical protein D3C81_513210 [compost metagenome]
MDNEVSGFRLEYRISNMSNSEMVVKTQGGLNYIIRKSKALVHTPKRTIYVKLPQARFSDLWLDTTSARSQFDQRLLQELEKERQRYQENNDLLFNNFSYDLTVCIQLTESLAEPETDVIHSDILGLTLFPTGESAGISALNTTDYTLQQLFAEAMEEQQPAGGLHYFIYLNDPLSIEQPLYVNVMGKAIQVPVVKDTSKAGGLYIGLNHGNATPHQLYYSFDKMDKDTLTYVGLFRTKAEASMGGNTERYLAAENKIKENNKLILSLQADYEKVVDQLSESQCRIAELGTELTHCKASHKHELQQVKNQHILEMSRLQITNELTKGRGEIDKMITKANTDFTKQRSTANNWGEIAKAVGAIAGVVITGYKLCTS